MATAETAQPTPMASSGSNFSLGFFFLSKDKREALETVYEYCRTIDDIVDEGLPKDEADRQLTEWTAELGRIFTKAPPRSALGGRLKAVAERFAIPRSAFDEMIRGCRMDLEGARYKNLADLESYMRGVAGSVGTMSVRIFGYSHTPQDRMDAFARDFGYAFQLTNIIRDVGADLELGRVYLPEADMAAAGYDEARLRARTHDAAFDALMKVQYGRAKDYYAKARSAVDRRDRVSLLPAEVMAHVYEGLLDEIAARGFRVLFGKTRLSPIRKLGLAAKAWLYCHGIGG
jgi:phytoene synthase